EVDHHQRQHADDQRAVEVIDAVAPEKDELLLADQPHDVARDHPGGDGEDCQGNGGEAGEEGDESVHRRTGDGTDRAGRANRHGAVLRRGRDVLQRWHSKTWNPPMQDSPPLSRILTDFVHDLAYDDLSSEVVHMTKALYLDWLGSALAG